MKARILILAALLQTPFANADEAIDRTGKWDVNGPLGQPTGEFSLTTDEGTWMNLDVHPDGEKLIFDLLGDLYLIPISGGEATRLTSGAAYDLQPRFSPSGDRVLFTSDRGGINAIWVADFDGNALSGAFVPTKDDLFHRGKVVGPFYCFNVKMSIILFTGFTVLENHTGCHRIGPLNI